MIGLIALYRQAARDFDAHHGHGAARADAIGLLVLVVLGWLLAAAFCIMFGDA